MYDMSKCHMLKTYIKHKKHNFITQPISNKIMNTKWLKNDCLGERWVMWP